MRLLLGHDAALCQWVADQIPSMPRGETPFGPATAIGVVGEDGHLRGAVVYHNHHPAFRNIELSFASAHPQWLSRRIISGLLAYPFAQLGCQRVTGCTPKRYADARRFLDKFGFKREGVIRKGFGTDDAIISGLLRSEWERSPWNLHCAKAAQPSRILHDRKIVRQIRGQECFQTAGSS